MTEEKIALLKNLPLMASDENNPMWHVDKIMRFHATDTGNLTRKNPVISIFGGMKKYRFGGIYKITCIANGRVYIGSAFNIFTRWTQHQGELRNKKHDNYKLQEDYNIYGPDAFIYQCVDRVWGPEYIGRLRRTETTYINLFKPYYNIRDKGGELTPSRRGSKYDSKIEFHFIDGKVEIPSNIISFCMENDLDYSNVIKVANGEINQHRTIRCKFVGDIDFRFKPKDKHTPKEVCKKYVVQNLDGVEKQIDNLHQFALENNYCYSSLLHCAAGRFNRYKGLRVRHADKDYLYVNRQENSKSNSKTWILRDKNTNQVFEVFDFKKYCDKNGMNYSNYVHGLSRKGQYKNLILIEKKK